MPTLAETILRSLPPEAAHQATLRALRLGLGRGAGIEGEGGITLFGKAVPNRIGLSGGADKNAEALSGWARLGFGFVEAGTVTVNPREGNPKPRIWRIGERSVVNAMGLPNLGIKAFTRNLAAYRATEAGGSRCVGASVASPDGKPGEMRLMAQRLGHLVDFLTLNASCPNTEHETPDLTGILAQVAELRDGAPQVPVLVKLGPTPALAALDGMADAFLEAGVAGFVACNTATEAARGLLGAHAPAQWPTRDGKPLGGYSGPGLLETSLGMVERLRARAGSTATVVGVGGVQSPKDLAAMLAAGADAVEVYTVVARGGVAALDALRLQDALMRREAAGTAFNRAA